MNCRIWMIFLQQIVGFYKHEHRFWQNNQWKIVISWLLNCLGGHMVCCCGKSSQWAAIHIRLCQWKVSFSCCKVDIVWNDHLLLSPMCMLRYFCWSYSALMLLVGHQQWPLPVALRTSASVPMRWQLM